MDDSMNEKEFFSNMPYEVWEKFVAYCDKLSHRTQTVIELAKENRIPLGLLTYSDIDKCMNRLFQSVTYRERILFRQNYKGDGTRSHWRDDFDCTHGHNTYRLVPDWQPPKPPEKEPVGEAYLKANPGCILRIEDTHDGKPLTVVVGDGGVIYTVVYPDGSSHYHGGSSELFESFCQSVLEISSENSTIIYPKQTDQK